jgi:DNA repair protein SbcC/Rad50
MIRCRCYLVRLVNKATEEYGKVAAKLASAKTERGSRERERAAAESRRRAAEKQLKAGFPAGIPTEVARAVTERRRQFEAARDREAAARKNLEKAREMHDKAVVSRAKIEQQTSELIQRCAEQRGVLGQLSTVSGVKLMASMKKPRAIVGDEVGMLNEWRRLIATGLERLRNSTEKEKKSETDALSRELMTMGLSLATTSLPNVQVAATKAIREASLAATRAADHAENLKRKLARRQEMEAKIAEARKRERLYRTLADELRQNRFIEYLLGESITRLASLASSELRGISGGRYGLIAEQSRWRESRPYPSHGRLCRAASRGTLAGCRHEDPLAARLP